MKILKRAQEKQKINRKTIAVKKNTEKRKENRTKTSKTGLKVPKSVGKQQLARPSQTSIAGDYSVHLSKSEI